MKEAERLESAINNKTEMAKAFETVCAFCFKRMQTSCDGCVVSEMEKEMMEVCR